MKTSGRRELEPEPPIYTSLPFQMSTLRMQFSTAFLSFIVMSTNCVPMIKLYPMETFGLLQMKRICLQTPAT